MTYTELIYNAFNISYFNFLDEKKEKPQRVTFDNFREFEDISNYRDFLEFYANYNEKTVARTKQYLEPKRHPTDTEKEFYNIGENFYIGNFFFESLLYSPKGENVFLEIIEKKRNIFKANLQELSETLQELDEEEKETYRGQITKLIDQKSILSYQEFLKKYDDTKQNYPAEFNNNFRNLGTSKNDYLEFLLSSNKSLKNIIKKKLETFIPNKTRYKHTYITGQSGSGKSELLKGLIFSVIRNKNENFILLDPHGDLADDIFNLSAKHTGKTILLDPFAEYEKTPIINPFDFIGTETELNSYTEELLNVFREVLGSDFTLNAEALLIPCISTLLKLDNSSLYDLQRFMNDEDNEGLVERGKITKNIAHKNFFENGFYSPNLNSTKRAIYLKIQILLNNKTFSNLTTGKSTLDIEEIMNTGQNLVIKLNKKKMRETLSPFGRFLIAKIQSTALKRADTPEHLRPKTHFFIDEFQNFISPTTEEILTESRKYRLFLTLAHQVISQLEESKLKDIILSNTNIKIVGQNGQKTLTALAKELGVKSNLLEDLKTGEFFVRIGKDPAFKMYHKLLNYKYFQYDETCKEYKRKIINEYYSKPQNYKPKDLKTDRKKDFINEVIKDKESKPIEIDLSEFLDVKTTMKPKEKEKQTEAQKRDRRKPKFNNF